MREEEKTEKLVYAGSLHSDHQDTLTSVCLMILLDVLQHCIK